MPCPAKGRKVRWFVAAMFGAESCVNYRSTVSEFRQLMSHADIRDLLSKFRPALIRVFKFYAGQDKSAEGKTKLATINEKEFLQVSNLSKLSQK